jgi:hypothetical protein
MWQEEPKCFYIGFLLGVLFDPEYGGDVLPKRQLTFNGLHGITSQKMVLFITTSVRTSNPTYEKKKKKTARNIF